jgi:hypothetical protein
MPESYFAVGATLAGMVNVETLVSAAPTVLDGGSVPFAGATKRRTLSGRTRRDGAAVGVWVFDVLTRVEYRALLLALYGNFTTESRALFVTSVDEMGYWSAFEAVVEKPYRGEDSRDSNADWMRDVTFALFDARLQSVTKTGTASLTASERVVYGNTAGSGFTLTLPAASAVQVDTVVSVEKTTAANTLTVQRAGADLVNGGTSLALTTNRQRVDLASDGVSAWRTVRV